MKIRIFKRIFPSKANSFKLKEESFTISLGIIEKIEKEELKFQSLKVGDKISIKGEYLPSSKMSILVKENNCEIKNDKYGQFIEVKSFEPDEDDKNIFYLDSLSDIADVPDYIINGIYNKFKENTINVLKNTPEEILSVKGVQKKDVEKISNALSKKMAQIELGAILKFFGVTESKKIEKIHKKLKVNCVEKINQNPYILVKYLGFSSVDKVALTKFGFKQNSEERINACMEYVLYQNENNGNTCMKEGYFKSRLSQISGINIDFSNFILNNEDVIIFTNQKSCNFISRKKIFENEDFIAKDLCNRLFLANKNDKKYNFQNIPNHLDTMQIEAIKSACINNVSIITGGPGTGKSTIIKQIVDILEDVGLDVALAAPTGKAAKRLAESTGRMAYTVHSTFNLKPDMELDFYCMDEQNFDVLIIDEISMLDVELFSTVLKLINHETKLIMVGDKDQLPSVKSGNILADLIESGRVPCVQLKKIFRQKGEVIPLNARKVNSRITSLDNGYDFLNVLPLDEESTFNMIVKSYIKACKIFGEDEVCCLIPFRNKGILCSDNFNFKIRNILNPPEVGKCEISLKGGLTFRVGDRVMETKNKEFVMNGDVGKITSINISGKTVNIKFNDEIITYDFDEMKTITHAYALTIHKSQGCEFKCVIINIMEEHAVMLNKNLFYTAITRGSEKVMVVGNGIEKAILNTRDKRLTLLKYLVLSY